MEQLSRRTGKSYFDTMWELNLAEKSGLLHTNEDGSVDIR